MYVKLWRIPVKEINWLRLCNLIKTFEYTMYTYTFYVYYLKWISLTNSLKLILVEKKESFSTSSVISFKYYVKKFCVFHIMFEKKWWFTEYWYWMNVINKFLKVFWYSIIFTKKKKKIVTYFLRKILKNHVAAKLEIACKNSQ